MRKGKQTHLTEALSNLSRRLDRSGGGRYLQVRVAAAWEAVAGPTVSGHTTRAHLREGELVVYVDSPIWATELSALSGPYREAMNNELGENRVRSLRFAVSRRVEGDKAAISADQESALTNEPSGVRPIPLSEVERAQVEASATRIPNDTLREAVIKATIAGMEWEKGRCAVEGAQERREGL